MKIMGLSGWLFLLAVVLATIFTFAKETQLEKIGTVTDIHDVSSGGFFSSTHCIISVDGQKRAETGNWCYLDVGESMCKYAKLYYTFQRKCEVKE